MDIICNTRRNPASSASRATPHLAQSTTLALIPSSRNAEASLRNLKRFMNSSKRSCQTANISKSLLVATTSGTIGFLWVLNCNFIAGEPRQTCTSHTRKNLPTKMDTTTSSLKYYEHNKKTLGIRLQKQKYEHMFIFWARTLLFYILQSTWTTFSFCLPIFFTSWSS